MPTSRDYDELRNMSLVQKKVRQDQQDAYELRVLSAKKYAAIEEAVQKQSITNALKAQLDANAKAHSDWVANEQAKINAQLAEMKRNSATDAEIAAKRRELNSALAAARTIQEEELAAKQLALNAEIAKSKEEDAKRIANIASRLADAEYNKATIYQRRQIQQELVNQAKAHKLDLQNKRSANDEAIKLLRSKLRSVAAGSEQEKAYQAQLTAQLEERETIKAQLAGATAAETEAYDKQLELNRQIVNAQKEYVLAQPSHNGATQLLENIESATEEAKAKLEQLNVEIAVNEKLGVDPSDIQALRDEAASIEKSIEGFSETAESLYAAAASEAADKKHDAAQENIAKAAAVNPLDVAREQRDERELEKVNNRTQAAADWANFMDPTQIGDKIGKAVANSVENIAGKVNEALNQIDANITAFYQYQSSVEARLQGSNESFQSSLKTISKNVGISGIIKQKEVIENIKKLSEAGVAYNLDLRAFLATVADDIAETFDVFDSNLMRLIRLQQSDTTAARLGMEASLNKLFNQYFSDTSYLTDAADSVSQAIIDANSQLTKNMSIEFEYMVQKWLGSLYSLGMDQGTISTIAQGLNYLGTGNVEALNSNESLQSLLAMSASRAGISYADILTGGLDASTTNDLMKSMIEYLKSIAENTDNNQVTKSAYSNVFGFSISDLTAVSSLSESDIKNIHNQSLDYQGAMSEYEYQASQIANRTHFSQMLDTVFDNAMMSASTTIGNNAGLYATWKVLNVIEDLTGGIAIPAISVMGNMVDLHATVTGVAKAGIAGLSLMSSLLSSLMGGSMFGTTSASKWGYDEFTSRGSGTKGISKGTAQGRSASSSMSMVGSSSASDMKSTSLSDSTDSAEEDAKITNKNVKENADIYQKIYDAIGNEDTNVLTEVVGLREDVKELPEHLENSFASVTAEIVKINDVLTLLLSPNRVFSAAVVSNIPLLAESFTVSTDNILTVTSETIKTAIDVANGITTTGIDSLTNAIESNSTTISNAVDRANSSSSSSSSSTTMSSTTTTSTSDSSLNPPAPEVNVPPIDVPPPEVTVPDVTVPAPEVDVPSIDVPAPDVNLPDINVPAPEVSVDAPTVTTPDVTVPAPDVQLPTIDVPVPEINTPSIDVPPPDVNIPDIDVPSPEVNLPNIDVPTPEVTVPDISVPSPDVSVPDITVPTPEVNVPTIDVDVPAPDVTVPDIVVPTPDITTPDVTVPTPEVNLPDIDVPTPNITSPDIEVPTPDVTIPDIAVPVPDVTIPDITVPSPEIITPDVVMPDINIPTIDIPAPEINSQDVQIFGTLSEIVQDVSVFGKDTTAIITKLESVLSTVDLQEIAKLSAETSVHSTTNTTDSAMNQVLTDDGLKVSIGQMSPEIGQYLAEAIKTVLMSSIMGNNATGVNGEANMSLMSQLIEVLQNSTLNVNIRNDNFDTALQKSMFIN